MEINETFKRIRKQRKLSLTKLSEVASSPAAISDFENGKTSLSVSTLVQLLGEMQVELTEFFALEKNQSSPDFNHFLRVAQEAFNQQDFTKLPGEMAKLDAIYKQTGKLKYRVLLLNIRLLLASQQGHPPNPTDVAELVDYFWSITIWTNFDIAMFGNVATFFETPTIVDVTKEILQTLPPQELTTFLESIKVDTGINSLFALLQRREKKQATELLKTLQELNLAEKLLQERLGIVLCQIIYQLLWENQEAALKKWEQLMGGVTLLLSENEVAELRGLFSQFLKAETP